MATITEKEILESHDFGFTFVDETEEVSKIVEKSKATSDTYKDRIERLMAAINPFLNKLKENPDKTYINWPNRTTSINEFQVKLKKILDGTS